MTGIKTSIHPQRPCQYTKYSPRPFRRLAAFLPRQNCFAPDSDGFSSDFWLLRRRCVVTPRNQIKAQQSGFDLKRKKERAKCSFRRKAETKWRKFLLTMRKGQKAPERHAVRRVCSCQPRVLYHNIRKNKEQKSSEEACAVPFPPRGENSKTKRNGGNRSFLLIWLRTK